MIVMRETRMTFPVTAPDWLRIQMRILLGNKRFPTQAECEWTKTFFTQPPLVDPHQLESLNAGHPYKSAAA